MEKFTPSPVTIKKQNILEHFNTKTPDGNFSPWYLISIDTGEPSDEIEEIITSFLSKDYIAAIPFYPSKVTQYKLTLKGFEFLSEGGFIKKEEREFLELQLKKLTILQAESTLLSTKIQYGVVIASLLISVSSFVVTMKSYNLSTEEARTDTEKAHIMKENRELSRQLRLLDDAFQYRQDSIVEELDRLRHLISPEKSSYKSPLPEEKK